MRTKIITMDEFVERSGKKWKMNNDCEFHGVISGYVCGFCVEAEKDGTISAGSCCFTNDYEEIRNPNSCRDWNDLGISEDLLNMNGWNATGNIIFRGYFKPEYDFDEREEVYLDASDEVMNLYNEYVS